MRQAVPPLPNFRSRPVTSRPRRRFTLYTCARSAVTIRSRKSTIGTSTRAPLTALICRAADGLVEPATEGVVATLPRQFSGQILVPGLMIGPAVMHRTDFQVTLEFTERFLHVQ